MTNETEKPAQTYSQLIDELAGKDEKHRDFLILELGHFVMMQLPQDEVMARLKKFSAAWTAITPIAELYKDDDDEQDDGPGWIGGRRFNSRVKHVHVRHAIVAVAKMAQENTLPVYFDGESPDSLAVDFGEQFWNAVACIAESMVDLLDTVADYQGNAKLKALSEL